MCLGMWRQEGRWDSGWRVSLPQDLQGGRTSVRFSTQMSAQERRKVKQGGQGEFTLGHRLVTLAPLPGGRGQSDVS